MNKKLALVSAVAAIGLAATGVLASRSQAVRWTDLKLQRIASLSLSNLPELAPGPSNAVADSPLAAELGRKLSFDTRLSAIGEVSCASCHIPEQHFQDGTPLGKGIGETTRRTMPIAGAAYSLGNFGTVARTRNGPKL